jgi:hypothetical protein
VSHDVVDDVCSLNALLLSSLTRAQLAPDTRCSCILVLSTRLPYKCDYWRLNVYHSICWIIFPFFLNQVDTYFLCQHKQQPLITFQLTQIHKNSYRPPIRIRVGQSIGKTTSGLEYPLIIHLRFSPLPFNFQTPLTPKWLQKRRKCLQTVVGNEVQKSIGDFVSNCYAPQWPNFRISSLGIIKDNC